MFFSLMLTLPIKRVIHFIEKISVKFSNKIIIFHNYIYYILKNTTRMVKEMKSTRRLYNLQNVMFILQYFEN